MTLVKVSHEVLDFIPTFLQFIYNNTIVKIIRKN